MEKQGTTSELGYLFSKYWPGSLPVFHFTPFEVEKEGEFVPTGNLDSFLSMGVREGTDFHCLGEPGSKKGDRMKQRPINFLRAISQMRVDRAIRHGKLKWLKILHHQGVTDTVPGAIMVDGDADLRRSNQKNANGTHYISGTHLSSSRVLGTFTFSVDYQGKGWRRVRDMPLEQRRPYLLKRKKARQAFKRRVIRLMIEVVFQRLVEQKEQGNYHYVDDLPLFQNYKLFSAEQILRLSPQK